MIEETATYDEHLMERNDEEISVDELRVAIRKGCIDNTFVPTLCGSAFKNKGVQRLLDSIVDLLPSPLDVGSIDGISPNDSDVVISREPSDTEPFSALAFKIMTDPYVVANLHEGILNQLSSGSYV